MTVTYPLGFLASGVSAGLKQAGALDLALVVNQGAKVASAGVFTTNRVQAAPVKWSKQVLASDTARAILLNSGGANAGTGAAGFADTAATAVRTAELLRGYVPELTDGQVAVCSTGLIGERLPLPKIMSGIEQAVVALDASGGANAAEAIMTTDTVSKSAIRDGVGYRLGGIAKGAGMLAPGMATMLCVITTDARLSSAQLQSALNLASAVTFNRLDSDGCMSTNDTIILLSSGMAEVEPEITEFTRELTELCADLSQQLLRDAEGASHYIAITVENAASEQAAEIAARAVARSNLFKTAIFGHDPNWGRIISALGTVPEADCPFDPDQISVAINGVKICQQGSIGADRNLVKFDGPEVSVVIDLQAGAAAATLWTNDLTHDYIHENSAYSS